MNACIEGKVSVILPVYNRAELMVEAVQSVLAQTYPHIELLIVDDGSTDDTGAVAGRLQQAHPDIVRVLHRENGGPGAAREAARLVATGEFIQYLDSDDLLMPRKLEGHVQALRAHPACGVAYGPTAYEDVTTGKTVYPWRRTGEDIPAMFPAFAADRWWGTSTPLYRRSVTDAAGPWLNLLNCEDWEYDCRIAAMGVALVRVGDRVSQQRHHPQARLSAEGTVDPVKLKHRAIAHTHIARHIGHAGLTEACAEVQRFAQLTFLLARQCGAAGLSEASASMMELVRTTCPTTVGATAKYRLYHLAGRRLGWTRIGRWSDRRDKRREKRPTQDKTRRLVC